MLTRREFIGATAGVGVGALAAACNLETPAAPPDSETVDALTIKSRPATPSIPPVVGYSALGLATPRDGFLYVPSTYNPGVPAPLLILLHGGGETSDAWRTDSLRGMAEGRGMVLLAPESRYTTWDSIQIQRYDVDVAFMDDALEHTFTRCNIDPARMFIGGFGDGATEAIGIGGANAGLFPRVVAHTPNFLLMPFIRGYPDFFVSHGINDDILSFAYTRDFTVPTLRGNGMAVEFLPFDGGHVLPDVIQSGAIEWLFQA